MTDFSANVMLWWPILYVFYPRGKLCKRKKKELRGSMKPLKTVFDSSDESQDDGEVPDQLMVVNESNDGEQSD